MVEEIHLIVTRAYGGQQIPFCESADIDIIPVDYEEASALPITCQYCSDLIESNTKDEEDFSDYQWMLRNIRKGWEDE